LAIRTRNLVWDMPHSLSFWTSHGKKCLHSSHVIAQGDLGTERQWSQQVRSQFYLLLDRVDLSILESSQIQNGGSSGGKKDIQFLHEWTDNNSGKLWSHLCEPNQKGVYLTTTEARKGHLRCYAFVTVSDDQMADLQQKCTYLKKHTKERLRGISTSDSNDGMHEPGSSHRKCGFLSTVP
jgi:hypothetical protein